MRGSRRDRGIDKPKNHRQGQQQHQTHCRHQNQTNGQFINITRNNWSKHTTNDLRNKRFANNFKTRPNFKNLLSNSQTNNIIHKNADFGKHCCVRNCNITKKSYMNSMNQNHRPRANNRIKQSRINDNIFCRRNF